LYGMPSAALAYHHERLSQIPRMCPCGF
jgi:hypothetical protein